MFYFLLALHVLIFSYSCQKEGRVLSVGKTENERVTGGDTKKKHEEQEEQGMQNNEEEKDVSSAERNVNVGLQEEK